MRGTSLEKRIRVSPNVEIRKDGFRPDMLVLHYTGMTSAEKACDWLCRIESKVSCHYLVDELGIITQMVDEDLRAWHAGESVWQGEVDTNSRSIGIEVHNPGHTGGYPDFPLKQMKAVAELSRDIIERYGIDSRLVLAHSDVAPGRKVDPGEKFDWAYLYNQGVGHWVQPLKLEEGPTLGLGHSGAAVEELQAMLRAYGYGIEVNGMYDSWTSKIVTSFQLHFRQTKCDGVADVSTIKTLKSLAA